MPEPLLEAREVSVTFRGRRSRSPIHALDQVSLTVGEGEIVGLVGESGSGKSTLARVVCGLQPPDTGAISFGGAELPHRRSREQHRSLQMIFQDPYASLDPRMSVRGTLAELLRYHRIVPREQVRARCEELIDLVRLPRALLDAKPGGMSGGQRQRVAIARALAVEPRVLVADEAVAALDVSVQAGVVNLLADLRERLRLSILFIAHDLAVVRSLCDRVSVIYLGRVVEEGPSARIFASPRHPYTKGLLAAVPRITGPDASAPMVIGEANPAMATAVGCRFAPRCPIAEEKCVTQRPELRGSAGHHAACHFAGRVTV